MLFLRRRLALALSLSLAAACSAPASDDAVRQSEAPLVGGELVAASDFPSTLLLEHGCTAAKVGPRQILLAAHCVHDWNTNQVRADFVAGQSLRVTAAKAVTLGDPSYQTLEIEATHLPAWWTNACTVPCAVNVLGPTVPADIALVVVKTDIVGIPDAAVDLRPVAVGESIVLTGTGCEAGVRGVFDTEARRQKLHRTHALAPGSLIHDGDYWVGDLARAGDVTSSIFITPGNAQDAAEASLCYGDSGGPVYRGDAVVGVNAYYTFLPEANDPQGISYTNWHTRLDAGSRYPVATWLADLGVPTLNSTEQVAATGRDAYATLEAESYDAESGTRTEACADTGGGQNVGYIANGDYLAFNAIDFGAAPPQTFAARVASGQYGATGRIEVRLDRLDGDAIATLDVGHTGGWQAWTTKTTTASGATGVHAVYVVFTSQGSLDFINLNSFVFAR